MRYLNLVLAGVLSLPCISSAQPRTYSEIKQFLTSEEVEFLDSAFVSFEDASAYLQDYYGFSEQQAEAYLKKQESTGSLKISTWKILAGLGAILSLNLQQLLGSQQSVVYGADLPLQQDNPDFAGLIAPDPSDTYSVAQFHPDTDFAKDFSLVDDYTDESETGYSDRVDGELISDLNNSHEEPEPVVNDYVPGPQDETLPMYIGYNGRTIYKNRNSDEQLAYLGVDGNTIYRNSNSWEQIAYIGLDGKTIYRNSGSWEQIAYIGMDKRTIYRDSSSWEQIAYISFSGRTIYENSGSSDKVGTMEHSVGRGLLGIAQAFASEDDNADNSDEGKIEAIAALIQLGIIQ